MPRKSLLSEGQDRMRHNMSSKVHNSLNSHWIQRNLKIGRLHEDPLFGNYSVFPGNPVPSFKRVLGYSLTLIKSKN